MALILVTGPTSEPVTLAEAKAHLRVDIDEDDDLIEALVATAREHLETISRPRVAMLEQTWRYVADAWPSSNVLELRPYPLRSVVSISYTDLAGAVTVISSGEYLVDTTSRPGRVVMRNGWPAATLQEINGLAIEFKAGYGTDPSAVPLPLRQAVLLLTSHWYETREPVLTTGAVGKEVPLTVKALFASWRRDV